MDVPRREELDELPPHRLLARFEQKVAAESKSRGLPAKNCGVAKTEGTCREILKRREALWTFVQVEGVEPTNNTAERSIRPGVQWRKGSFGTQSEAGSRFVESMMTVVATLKQQNRNVLDYLTAAHEAALRDEPAPSLLSAPEQKSQAAA
jgi:transposase